MDNIIKNNITRITRDIPEDVQLIAVTKNRSIDEIRNVIKCGINTLGENRVQEFIDKFDQIDHKVNWHLIGHLQRNKVKYIIGKVSLIHSVDSLRLLEEINNQSKKQDVVTNILIQVNVSEEKSKYGLTVKEINDFLSEAGYYKNIAIKGLMTMAPNKVNIEEIRSVFSKLRVIYDKIKEEQYKYENIDMKFLSMGMSNDYSIAVEEGANMIRIGRGIFDNQT